MDSTIHRLIITEKGKQVQKNLMENSTDFTKFPYEKSIIHCEGESKELPSFRTYTCRDGYFRPKKNSHTRLKSVVLNRPVPNYLRNSREYPLKHEYSWNPEISDLNDKKNSRGSPPQKETHHPLLNYANYTLTIRESNSLIADTQLPLNLTLGDSSAEKVSIQEKQRNLATDLTKKTSFKLSGRRFSSEGNFKRQKIIPNLPLDKIANKAYSQQPDIKLPFYVNNNRIVQGTHEKTYSQANKIFLDKTDQIRRKFFENQKEYERLLSQIYLKRQEKLAKQLESPEYLNSFQEQLQKGDTWLEELKKIELEENQRYRERIKAVSIKKYQKGWKKCEGLLKKIKLPKNFENLATIDIRKEVSKNDKIDLTERKEQPVLKRRTDQEILSRRSKSQGHF